MSPRPVTPETHPYIALVVDDDATMRVVLRQVLERSECQVLEAEHGQRAVELFRQQPTDIVLLDVMMPVMNGIEACGHIRAAPGGNASPSSSSPPSTIQTPSIRPLRLAPPTSSPSPYIWPSCVSVWRACYRSNAPKRQLNAPNKSGKRRLMQSMT
ncbi:MAG: response regulator [Anaerolineales bacterium]